MEALYRAQRSYRFASLSTSNPISAALQGNPPQEFHGIFCPLGAAEFAVLQQQGSTMGRLKEATLGIGSANPVAGKADVRLTHVRFFLTGTATTSSGLLAVTLTHSGFEYTVDTDGARPLPSSITPSRTSSSTGSLTGRTGPM